MARGDQETRSWGQYGKAHALARTGEFPLALQLAETSVDSLIARSSRNTVGIGYGVLSFVRLQASDYVGAREAAERSRSASFRACCVFEYVGTAFPLLVESLLGPYWAAMEGGPSRAVAKKAWREAQFARFITWRFPNYHPHALRVSGRAAYALGKTKKAASYLERSIVAAEKLGAATTSPAPCSTPPASSRKRPTTTAAEASNSSTHSAPSSPRPSGCMAVALRAERNRLARSWGTRSNALNSLVPIVPPCIHHTAGESREAIMRGYHVEIEDIEAAMYHGCGAGPGTGRSPRSGRGVMRFKANEAAPTPRAGHRSHDRDIWLQRPDRFSRDLT